MTNAEQKQKYHLIVCVFSNNYIAIALHKAAYKHNPLIHLYRTLYKERLLDRIFNTFKCDAVQ